MIHYFSRLGKVGITEVNFGGHNLETLGDKNKLKRDHFWAVNDA